MKALAAKLWQRHCPDVLVRKLIGDVAFTISLRDHALWAFQGNRAVEAEQIPWPRNSMVWDVGCNIGVFSAQAAALGNQVIAFDISRQNIEALNRTIRSESNWPNGLARVTPVLCPVTVTPRPWALASSGHPEEAIQVGDRMSLTYHDAADRYGTPKFIKMDIQGAELEFLQSREWKAWLDEHKITWFVEIHQETAKHVPGFLQYVDATHFIYRP